MDIGDAIRTGRNALGLTQDQLGSMSGLTRQAVALAEKNAGRVSTLQAIRKHIPLATGGLPAGEHIGAQLRIVREEDGLSLREAAARAALAVNTLRDVEQGKGSIVSLRRVAAALKPKARIVFAKNRALVTGFVTVGRRTGRAGSSPDYFPTPAPITRLLLDHEAFAKDDAILEPTVGEARAIERVLLERGFKNVICSDLHGKGREKRDFFDVTKRYHTIITNPPFSIHRPFIEHSKKIATHKIALLLPVNFLTGAGRHETLWTDRRFPLARVHVLNRGIDFLASEPFGERFHSSQMYCAWFIFERSHQGPPTLHWIDSNVYVVRKGLPRKRIGLTSQM